MYQVIYYIIFLPVLIYSCYFFISSLFAFRKCISYPSVKPKNKFAILIAARNESAVIGGLIDSLMIQDYPKELFDVYVIANNCTDDTKGVSLKAGAKVLEYESKISSKGDALKLAFNDLGRNYDYDAYAIFDADNIVDVKFLEKMNDAIEAGCPVMQAYRDTKNITDSWVSASYALFYWGQNFFFGQSRFLLNSSTNINGTGFVVTKKVIEEYGFNTTTITEDIEFTGQCALNGVRVTYIKDAITYDEQPVDFATSWKQRKRWSTGTMDCCHKYSMKLLKKASETGDLFCLDMGLFYLAPYIQLIGSVLFCLLVLYNFIGIQLYDLSSYLFALKEWFFILGLMFSIGMAVLVVKLSKKSVKQALKGVIMFTLFMLSWLPINIICLFKKTVVWEEIKHTKSIGINSINK